MWSLKLIKNSSLSFFIKELPDSVVDMWEILAHFSTAAPTLMKVFYKSMAKTCLNLYANINAHAIPRDDLNGTCRYKLENILETNGSSFLFRQHLRDALVINCINIHISHALQRSKYFYSLDFSYSKSFINHQNVKTNIN